MTYLGTRPPTVDEWDKYELHHRARLATKPGLTGMWQVSGRSNIGILNILSLSELGVGTAITYLTLLFEILWYIQIEDKKRKSVDETSIDKRKAQRI